MRKMMVFLIVFGLIMMTGSSVFSQMRFEGGGNFTLAFPQTEFAENVDNTGFGGTLFGFAKFPNSPLSIGASFGFIVYGSETYEERLIPTAPVWVDVTTTNSIINGHLVLRLEPPGDKVIPYLDGLIGFNYLFTETRIEDQDWDDDDDVIASTKNLDDFTFSYGIGGGLKIKVWTSPERPVGQSGVAGLYIDLGLRYLKGGEAEYMKEGSIEADGDDITYDINKSTTDILTGHIGVSVAF